MVILYNHRKNDLWVITQHDHHNPLIYRMKMDHLKQLDEIIKRGSTTPEEAFRVSYGDWPPVGLDTRNYSPILTDIRVIDNKFVFKEIIKGNLRRELLSRWLHPAHYFFSFEKESHVIALKYRHIFHDYGRQLLGHEALHAAQFEASAVSGYWLGYFFSNPNAPKKCDFSESQEVMKAVFAADRSKTKNKKKPPAPLWKFIAAKLIFSMFGEAYFKSFGAYIKSGREIQAYMHEMFAANYAKWRQIPYDKTTLWAALSQASITAPAQIMEYLTTSAEGKQSIESFQRLDSQAGKTTPVVMLNASYKEIKSDMGKRLFWQFGLPLLYGQLLEIYGDPEGRVKMGFTPKSQGLARNLADLNKYRSRKFRSPCPAL